MAKVIKKEDQELMIGYRNTITMAAAHIPRVDDIDARFLMTELQEKIANALSDFDDKRREFYDNF